MKRLLAIGVIGCWKGEWQRAQGNERAIVAAPIGEREEIYVEVDRGDSVERILLSHISLPFELTRESRYRVVKECSGVDGAQATTVEVILSNGSPST